jgi:hypothetical protein
MKGDDRYTLSLFIATHTIKLINNQLIIKNIFKKADQLFKNFVTETIVCSLIKTERDNSHFLFAFFPDNLPAAFTALITINTVLVNYSLRHLIGNEDYPSGATLYCIENFDCVFAQ